MCRSQMCSESSRHTPCAVRKIFVQKLRHTECAYYFSCLLLLPYVVIDTQDHAIAWIVAQRLVFGGFPQMEALHDAPVSRLFSLVDPLGSFDRQKSLDHRPVWLQPSVDFPQGPDGSCDHIIVSTVLQHVLNPARMDRNR